MLLAPLPWVPQAHAGDTRIGFNDLPDSTTVSTQYQTLGVVFQDSFPAGGGSDLPTIRKTAVAASAPNILDIRAPGGGEFRTNAVVGRFADPHNHARVVAGDWAADVGHMDAATVTLAAYTLGGHVIEQQTAMVKSGEAFHVALSVSAASNSIYFFSISTGFDHYVGIDDLSFDPVGGSPAGFALTRDRPADEPVVVRPGAVGVGTNIVIRRSSSSSGPINLSVAGLPAGVGVGFAANPTSGGDGATDQLTLTAALGMSGATATLTVSGVGGPAAGSGTPVSIPLIVAGYGYDAEVTGIEVTQGVQDLRLPERGVVATAPASYTGVKLMARGKTIVRVYADLRRGYQSSIVSLDGVDVDLYGYRPGSSTPLAGGPLHPSLDQHTLKLAVPCKPGEGAVSDAERANPSGAFTFVLPPDWTTGTISLKATIYPPADLLPSLLECPGVACQDNNSFTLSTIRFTPTGYLEIAPVALSVKGDDTLSVPSAVCYKTVTHHDGIEEVSGAYACTSSGVFAGVRNISPSDVGVPTGYAGAIDVSDIAGNTSLDDTMRGAAAAARLWDFANARSEWFRNDVFDVHSDALVVGVYPQGAAIRSTTHYDNAGNILDDDEFPVAVVPDGGRPLTAVAHEIYHMLGRQHADHSVAAMPKLLGAARPGPTRAAIPEGSGWTAGTTRAALASTRSWRLTTEAGPMPPAPTPVPSSTIS